MRRPGLAIAILILAAGCAARPDPDALVTRQVDGAFTITHWADDGAQVVVADGSVGSSSISAVSMVKGQERVAQGTVKSDGTFTIPAAPEGPYLLVLDSRTQGYNVTAWETSVPTIAIDRAYAGRYDAALARTYTPVDVLVSGLEPWVSGASGSILEAESSNAGFLAILAGTLFGGSDLPDGAVDTSALPLYDWYTRVRVPYLPDAAQGDTVYVHQLQPRQVPAGQPGAGLPYVASSRFALLTNLTLVSGALGSLQAPLADAAPVNVALTLPISQWEGLVADMGAFPTAIGTVTSIAATPFETTLPAPWIEGGIPDLLYAFVPAGSPNLTSVPVTYGRFLGSLWHEVEVTEFRAAVQYPVSGGQPVVMYAKAYRADAMTGTLPALTPVVSPPSSPQVNGKSLFQQEAGITATPVFSWSVPRVGTASSYEVEIFRLNSNSTASLVFHAYVRSTSLRVPSGILLPSTTYFARITAHSAPWDVDGYLGTFGFAPAFPYAFASCLTSTFTP